MGKNYTNELLKTDQTYLWALKEPIGSTVEFIERSNESPMIAIGSGGSYSAACMAALLHQNYSGMGGFYTPLEVTHVKKMKKANILIVSSEGRNNDILSIFDYSAKIEPLQLMALCMKAESPLAELCKKYRYTQYCGFNIPTRKDGFLATNSLFATIILLVRAYQEIYSDISKLSNSILFNERKQSEIIKNSQCILGRKTLVVLYSGWGYPSAIDLESKATEGALVNVQLADYRNFAHGRHHWLAKKEFESGIVALITPDDIEIAEKTLALIPKEIPILRIITSEKGPIGTIDLLMNIFYFVQILGKFSKINPGMPRIPVFGRKIYHLKSHLYVWEKQFPRNINPIMASAILRKTYFSLTNEIFNDGFWKKAYNDYIQKIESVSYGSLVLDYDGTLCDNNERSVGPCEEIISLLETFLKNDILIGIATGRGKSIRTDLQNAINKKYWRKILIGYYNGSDIGFLDEEAHPETSEVESQELSLFYEKINGNNRLQQMASIKKQSHQITIEPKKFLYLKSIEKILVHEVNSIVQFQLRLFKSSHSFDVVDNFASKRNLVYQCQKQIENKNISKNVLCIGDKGKWPGNDFELLLSDYTLSVDSVSPDPLSCWNLSPPGQRGVQATMTYLSPTIFTKGKGFNILLNNKNKQAYHEK
ncbi:MAG: HAD hydrolase family protein [Methanoregula sp.]|jgi:hydroxymethylpyrimidine pyrophosphatase-like HAD family hydrolase|uniref:HAD hydrolase family protein n=1 Tax=Methanoregula sp. TaxID=2052170 RepID=UPI003C1E72C5